MLHISKAARLLFGFFSCATVSFAATNTLLYTDDFESYPAGTVLINTNSWFASSEEVKVQTAVKAPGSTKAAMIPIDVTLSNRFAAAESTNVWLHMMSRIVRYSRDVSPTYDTNSTAIFYVNKNGYLVVRNGTSGWDTVFNTLAGEPAEPITEDVFTTVDVYLNYDAKTWRININSVPMTNNISFANTNMAVLTGFDIYNAGISTSYLDNVTVNDSDMLPRLSAFPSALTNQCVHRNNAPDMTFDVISTGDGEISYYIVTNTDLTWVTITNNVSGVLTNNGTNTVSLTFDTSGLQPGPHSNSFTIVSTNLEGQTVLVPMTLNVLGMFTSPTNLASSRMEGFAADTQDFNVIQSGDGAIHYTISEIPETPWLALSQTAGDLTKDSTNTIHVSYSTNGLVPGTVTSTLEVATTDAGGVTQFVAVAMTTFSRPLPVISFTNYHQVIQKGMQPVDTNLFIGNAGVFPRPRVNFSVTSDVPWLNVYTNGTLTNVESRLIAVRFNDMTTNAGLYTGRLTYSATDAGTGYTPTGMVTVSTQVTVSVLVIAPGKPTALSATKGLYTDRVTLNWNTSTNMDHFEIWRGTNSDVALATRAESSVTSTSYNDTVTLPGLINYYWVRIVNAYGGAGEFSDPDTGWRQLLGPTDLDASDGLYTNRVALTWTAAIGAVNYQIMRSTINVTNSAVSIAVISGALTSYDDTTAIVETPYYYWVKTVTPYMNAWSTPDTGYRAALLQPQAVVASDGEFTNRVRVIWQPVDRASNYEVWRNLSADRASAAKIGETTASGYDDENAAQGVTFYYWIRAANYEGYSRYSDPDSGWRKFMPPAGVSASDGTHPYRIRLSWTPTQNATGYEVWRGDADAGNGAARGPAMLVAETPAAYYDDHAVAAATLYYYRVKAKNNLGSSDYSASDTGYRLIGVATTDRHVLNDYDGDRLADLVLYNSTSGVWKILYTIAGEQDMQYGSDQSTAVAGDYDGDGLADPMIYRPGEGLWFVMLSSIHYIPVIAGSFGGHGYPSAVADFDGDGMTDLAVYNEAGGVLSVLLSNNGAFNVSVNVPLGGAGWTPSFADYDGDAKADLAVYSQENGLLAVKLSTGNYAPVAVPIGGVGITLHPADYDGDRLADLVSYQESTGLWIAKLSSANYSSVSIVMGGPGYAPVVSDYDGDSLADPAVYSISTGAWLLRFSASGYSAIDDTYGGTNWVAVGQ